MGAKTKSKNCYFCGKPALSKEHVPPRLMFEPFGCSSITVPSCADHNSRKSGDDVDIVHTFLLTLKQDVSYYTNNADILRAINSVQSDFHYTHRHMSLEPFMLDPPPELRSMPDLVRLHGDNRVYAWVRQLTAGLVYSATNKYDPDMDWQKAIAWGPSYYQSSGPLSRTKAAKMLTLRHKREMHYQFFEWRLGWSASPLPYPRAIYHFDVQLRYPSVSFRHTFYQQFCFYVDFVPTELIYNALMKKLERSG